MLTTTLMALLLSISSAKNISPDKFITALNYGTYEEKAVKTTQLNKSKFVYEDDSNVILDVPFVHQIDDLPEDKKGEIRNTACGPSSLTMSLNFEGLKLKLYDVIEKLPTSVYVKGRYFVKLGDGPKYFDAESIKVNSTPKEFFETLKNGHPIVLSIRNYDGVGGHAVVVVGIKNFDAEKGKAEALIVHDPFKEAYREFKYLNDSTLQQPEGYTLSIVTSNSFYVVKKS